MPSSGEGSPHEGGSRPKGAVGTAPCRLRHTQHCGVPLLWLLQYPAATQRELFLTTWRILTTIEQFPAFLDFAKGPVPKISSPAGVLAIAECVTNTGSQAVYGLMKMCSLKARPQNAKESLEWAASPKPQLEGQANLVRLLLTLS